jgi:hemolysin activation/secretion protein
MVYGLTSDSNVATVGATDVIGPGQVVGTRAVITLPPEDGFYHTLSIGGDYKHFAQVVGQAPSFAPGQVVTLAQFLAAQAANQSSTPITYYPFTAAYSATWQGDGTQTQLNAGVTWSFRGLGSTPGDFDARRFKSSSEFIYYRGDLARTQDLPAAAQAYGKLQVQIADGPLVQQEQMIGGGLDSVRGYREAETLGDEGLLGQLELRSPSFHRWLGEETAVQEWRVYFFTDGGRVSIHAPLPEQQSIFWLGSFGLGSRLHLLDYLNGQFDLAVPVATQNPTRAFDPHFKFRLWGEF